jgi:phage baseplate assembly protein W|tara:strand:+ start:927 stop:1373 length:447 start_codon:yes stop_codon:yes gene_type:complete
MATSRALSAEDGFLEVQTLVGTRSKAYQDIDLTFKLKPNGDVYKKTDAAAVKQSVKNLLLTNHYEKPFQPYFGGNLNDILFELANDTTSITLRDDVVNAINNYEERAKVLDVKISDNIDRNEVKVKVIFQVKNLNDIVEVETTLSRLR